MGIPPPPPSPLRKHQESQESDGQTGSWCLDKAVLAQGGGGGGVIAVPPLVATLQIITHQADTGVVPLLATFEGNNALVSTVIFSADETKGWGQGPSGAP